MAKLQERAAEYRWDDLRILLALVRDGTLGGAAARLGVDATTIGRRLTALEQALGARLFDRTRDGVVSTEAALRLVPLAEETERSAAAVFASANAFERAPEGRVRLTTPPVMAEAFVVPRLAALRARHPGLRLEIDASAGLVDLTRREADLALRVKKPEGADLVAIKLLETPYALFASATLAGALGTLDELGAAPFIGWTDDLGSVPAARWASTHLPGDAVFAVRASSMSTQIAAAQHGLGMVLLPSEVGLSFGLSPLPPGPVVAVALAKMPAEIVWVVGHRALRSVPRVAAVWEFFAEQAAALAPRPAR